MLGRCPSPSRSRHRPTPQHHDRQREGDSSIQEEFYATAFRKKLYTSLEELQADLDGWLDKYNRTRPHSGKYCYGKTPMQTFLDSLSLAREKMLDAQLNPAPATARPRARPLAVNRSVGSGLSYYSL